MIKLSNRMRFARSRTENKEKLILPQGNIFFAHGVPHVTIRMSCSGESYDEIGDPAFDTDHLRDGARGTSGGHAGQLQDKSQQTNQKAQCGYA
jgi:hypothetical protein